MILSVVVTVVDGAPALERCLDALGRQEGASDLEIVVPWDDSLPSVPAVAKRFTSCRFLGMGHVVTDRPVSTAAGQHELFDRRRAAGLAAVTGDVVSILEDRGVPRSDWARTMLRLHRDLPYAVIGGAVENGMDVALNWAVYFCDFGRYQRPFEAAPRTYVSDVNISYKRRALESTARLWKDRYHETTVHWALLRAGETLFLSPEPVVDQCRGALRVRALVGERVAWGRLFAYTRAREARRFHRLALACGSLFLPIVLFTRLLRLQVGKQVTVGRFVRVSPAVLLLLAAWSAGEAIGYLTRRP